MTTRNLSWNDLGNKTDAELKEAFSGLPATVTTLGLRGNALGNKTGAELKEAFSGLPATVTTLDLSCNALGFKSGAELSSLFGVLYSNGITNIGEDKQLNDMYAQYRALQYLVLLRQAERHKSECPLGTMPHDLQRRLLETLGCRMTPATEAAANVVEERREERRLVLCKAP